jgi:hypothetical protein
MGFSTRTTCLLIFTALSLLAVGCTEPLSSRSVEERYLGMGYAQQMYRYGDDLLKQGRYQEAYTAFDSAEKAAHTQSLRQAARERRMWLGEYIRARQEGREPPAQPITRGDSKRIAPVPMLPPPASPQPPDNSPSTSKAPVPIVEKPLAPAQ